MFSALKSAGVHDIYLKTIEVIQERGISDTLVYDPYSGAVDMYGAIMLACGANLRLLSQGCDNPVSCGVPDSSLRSFIYAVEYLEAMTQDDLAEWAKKLGKLSVIRRLQTFADRIEMSVTPSTTFRY